MPATTSKPGTGESTRSREREEKRIRASQPAQRIEAQNKRIEARVKELQAVGYAPDEAAHIAGDEERQRPAPVRDENRPPQRDDYLGDTLHNLRKASTATKGGSRGTKARKRGKKGTIVCEFCQTSVCEHNPKVRWTRSRRILLGFEEPFSEQLVVTASSDNHDFLEACRRNGLYLREILALFFAQQRSTPLAKDISGFAFESYHRGRPVNFS